MWYPIGCIESLVNRPMWNSGRLYLAETFRPEEICRINITLTPQQNQTVFYSSIHHQIYNLEQEGNLITAEGNGSPQHFKMAFEQTLAQLPHDDQAHWWNSAYQYGLTTLSSGAITLFTEDLALAYGYTPKTAAWFSHVTHHSIDGSFQCRLL